MLKTTTLFFLLSICQISLDAQSSIEIDGTIKIGNSDSCHIGSIRWSGKSFEGYNGVKWVALDNSPQEKVKDIDGNEYRTVRIGGQVWMAENLRAQRFNDGTPIDNDVSNSDWTDNFVPRTPAYCWYDNDSTTYHAKHGILYNGWTVDTIYNGGKNVCPSGWSPPTNDDFTELRFFLGGDPFPYYDFDLAECLKANDPLCWNLPVDKPDNSTGFSGIGSGVRGSQVANFNHLKKQVHYWTMTRASGSGLYTIRLFANDKYLYYNTVVFNSGHSIRCLKD